MVRKKDGILAVFPEANAECANGPKSNRFVSVFIDDVLIYSRTLPEHLKHLELVI